MKTGFLRALVSAAVLTVAGSSAASAQGTQLHAILLGGNEVSGGGAANVGDPDGFGAASITFRGRVLCIGTVVSGIDPPIAMHIHDAKAGVNSGIFVPLNPPASGDPGHQSQCKRISDAQAAAIQANPNLFYLNVHTELFQAGALRGQLF